MNEQMRCAYVIAQAAMLSAEIAAMHAENVSRLSRGKSPAYGEKQFLDRIEFYESVLGYNGAVTYLLGT